MLPISRLLRLGSASPATRQFNRYATKCLSGYYTVIHDSQPDSLAVGVPEFLEPSAVDASGDVYKQRWDLNITQDYSAPGRSEIVLCPLKLHRKVKCTGPSSGMRHEWSDGQLPDSPKYQGSGADLYRAHESLS